MDLSRLYVIVRDISVFRSDKIGGPRWRQKSGANAFATSGAATPPEGVFEGNPK
jgi:hypothetical protein